ncbi:ATP synthase F1 subunit gamma [Desulforhopalus vacuolatus]|uniref:ATP synthase F1 subunit gamma n=1 Tax=Desulforhopalus vacuolatus TaxID=40414 RepID=UPI001964FD9F|nr:ATP synthase F1 subunit gamma [Desulforhopalus vacuolatus]MBM9519327.1 ATP synthase F1 subunit gamma [Desulforhopalus vacuolatus]
MASLKEVKLKITGVQKTSQITRAMNMVAAAKLRGAQDKMEAFRPYTTKFNETMSNLASGDSSGSFPLMEEREVKKVELVVFTSDRGLCGSFNANVVKEAWKHLKKYEAEGKEVTLLCIGKKGFQLLKNTGRVREGYKDIMGKFQMFHARDIASNVSTRFLAGEVDKVELIYGAFHSVAVQRPAVAPLLPVVPHIPEGEKAGMSGDYIYEPSIDELMVTLQPLYLNVQIYHAMLEVGASEQAARMTAMDAATTACKDIVGSLTTIYNKARQAAVTNELLDIVGGAEALK